MPTENKRATKLPHPITLIFGAGASRGGLDKAPGVPPPVDKDFFDIANQLVGHGTPKLAKKVLNDVWQLYQRTNAVGLETYYRDLETRAIIGEFAKTANQPKDWGRRQKELEELIRRVYVHTTVSDTRASTVSPKKSPIHKNILAQLRSGDTIITFNYDLIIEESFSSAELWNPIDGYGIKTSGKTKGWTKRWLQDRQYRSGGSKLSLLKLHGSLNWESYPNGTAIRLKPKPYLVSTRNGKTRFEKISILAPGWKKPIDKNPYKKFWREARLQLEKCKTLIILGYSLPETDLLAQSLIAEVVRTRAARNELIRQLHLADHNETVKERFIRMFTPALGSHGKIFKYRDVNEFNQKLGLTAG
ncbi:MAG: SIR2 family protein [Candidatus Acidiferrales bacterium]